MPRTKQIHPRNLRDKIEEAQKELNGAEVSKKGPKVLTNVNQMPGGGRRGRRDGRKRLGKSDSSRQTRSE